MTDLVIGFAANYDWPAIEPYAVSLVRSGFAGHKILFVQGLASEAEKNLLSLGFSLIAIPVLEYSDPKIPLGTFFAYVGRFLLIHQFLYENPGYRFVVCSDTRDVVFQHDPMKWMEKNIGSAGLVAASEHIRHCDQDGNSKWIDQCFKEIAPWLMPFPVYCSGVVSGRAEQIVDLALAIYLMGRNLSGTIWGADQPAYNAIMHQKAYADITRVPAMRDYYCLNMVVLAFSRYREVMFDFPPMVPLSSTNIGEVGISTEGYTLPDLRNFTILHQYDRIPELAETLRAEYRLANLGKPKLCFTLSDF